MWHIQHMDMCAQHDSVQYMWVTDKYMDRDTDTAPILKCTAS